MPTFGLISRRVGRVWRPGTPLDVIESYETRQILRAAEEIYGHFVVIDPTAVAVDLPRGARRPLVLHKGVELKPIDTLMVRSAAGLGDALGGAVRALVERGSDLLDPLDRMGSDAGTKLYTSFDRFATGVGSTTSLAFSLEAARALLERLAAEDRLPLFAKPIRGRRGEGVVLLETRESALTYAEQLFSERPDEGKAVLLVQPYERFVAEYRVLVFFGRPLGIARKTPAEGALAANAARGGQFAVCDRADIAAWTAASVNPVGIIGADVGEMPNGELRLIEANRAPLWEAFDHALGIDSARELVSHARQRLEEPILGKRP